MLLVLRKILPRSSGTAAPRFVSGATIRGPPELPAPGQPHVRRAHGARGRQRPRVRSGHRTGVRWGAIGDDGEAGAAKLPGRAPPLHVLASEKKTLLSHKKGPVALLGRRLRVIALAARSGIRNPGRRRRPTLLPRVPERQGDRFAAFTGGYFLPDRRLRRFQPRICIVFRSFPL